MRRIYQISGVIFLLFAAFIGYMSMQLTYYTSIGPGPGFFPFWLCVILALLSLGMIYQATTHEADPIPHGFFAGTTSYLRNAAVIVGLIGAAALLDYLGFIITMFIFYFLMLSILARRHLVETVVLALIGSLGVYYLFSHFLSRPLPWGLFGF